MNWVIQDRFYNEFGHLRLLAVLEQMEIPYHVVKLDPGLRELTPDVRPENPVMVCGSTTMCGIAQARGWTPGSFLNENFDYRVWAPGFGELALNQDARIVRFQEVENWYPRFFVRVIDDSKSFPGGVISWEEFERRQREVLEGKARNRTLEPETLVVVAPVKQIYFERRYFVVDGCIITSSQYRAGGVPRVSDDPHEECDEVAKAAIARFSPSRAFVIDMAGTPDGIKVVEINCFNSAAFYACNVGKLVETVERTWS